jgi:hypothetical protein
MRGYAGALFAALLLLPLSTRAADDDSTCVSCHADEDDEELSAPVDEWKRSVHATAEVSCDACHGGGPFEQDEELSMDEASGYLGAPGWADVPQFCGACHEEILDSYKSSVMAGKIEEGEKVAVCTTCHMTDGHAIVASRPGEILTEERCGECHDAARAVLLRDVLDDMHDRIASTDAALADIRDAIDVSKLDHELGDIRHRAVVIAHTYDLDRITEVWTVAKKRLNALDKATEGQAEMSASRQRLGIGVTGFLLLTCFGIIGMERDVRRRTRS